MINVKQAGFTPFRAMPMALDKPAYPLDHGVAWVYGNDRTPKDNFGFGMTLHMGRAPVEVRPKMRGVVIKQGHKFCWLRLAV